MNLRANPIYLNSLPLCTIPNAPRPPVEIMTRANPIIIVFFVPSQFLIRELNGENMTYATEKEAIIILISLSVNPVYPLDVVSHEFESTKRGKKALRLATIIFPIRMTTMTPINVLLFAYGEKSSFYYSSSSYFLMRCSLIFNS